MNFPAAESQVIHVDGADAGWAVVNALPCAVRLL
jgi:hypothetical protein